MLKLLYMNPLLNPFSPGAGTPPPALAGRSQILTKAEITLARVKAGRFEKSFLLVGLKGVGKTVLLYKIEEIAKQNSYKTIMIEAREDKSFIELLVPYLRQLLFSLDTKKKVNYKLKKAYKVLKSFVLKIDLEGKFELGVDIDPERGVADSGDLETDLTQLFIALGEAVQAQSTAIAIIIDEMQYLNKEELSSLLMAVHKINQKSLPLIVVGAGLPQLLSKAGNAKSYAERLFDYPEVGSLNDKDAKKALQDPVKTEGVMFTKDALNKILETTQRYPYFLQEWGYRSWLSAKKTPITLENVNVATNKAIESLDQNFFRVRFNRLTPKEKKYLLAMAKLGEGIHKSGEIAKTLNTTAQSMAPIRSNLIKKGIIFSPSHGDTQFTVPLFTDFMKRTKKLEKNF